MTNPQLFFVLIILMINISCNDGSKFEADWIIEKIEYKEEDIISDMIGGNLVISYSYNGVTPMFRNENFNDEKVVTNSSFSYKRIGEKDYLQIKATSFFTDEFEVKCLDQDCCRIQLLTDKKLVECIFNADLLMNEKRHRKCDQIRLLIY